MKLAEELYQAGFISYPRTETDQFDAGYDLLVSAAQMLPLPRFKPLLKSDMTGLCGNHGKLTICPALSTHQLFGGCRGACCSTMRATHERSRSASAHAVARIRCRNNLP